jgi:hypothetical protein
VDQPQPKPTTYALALRRTEALLILVLAFAVLQLRDQVADLNSRIGVFQEFKHTVTTLRYEHQAIKDRLAQVPITFQDHLKMLNRIDHLTQEVENLDDRLTPGRMVNRLTPNGPTSPTGRPSP